MSFATWLRMEIEHHDEWVRMYGEHEDLVMRAQAVRFAREAQECRAKLAEIEDHP